MLNGKLNLIVKKPEKNITTSMAIWGKNYVSMFNSFPVGYEFNLIDEEKNL